MKRKASALDEQFSCDWQHSDSLTMTPSPESTHTNQNSWHVLPVPYLNSRTQKRYRDNRPDEVTVHQRTIAKLFDAQRKLHDVEIAEQQRLQQVDSYLMSLDTFEPDIFRGSHTGPKQTSINSFFGGAQRLPPARPWAQFGSGFPTLARDEIPVCEDCSSRLTDLNGGMDVDMDMDVDSSAWSCGRCAKRVCDTCAVRGHRRLCLECAVPGGGH